jgi:hypothetical protein
VLIALVCATATGGATSRVADGYRLEVVATGLHRPIQLALDPTGRLVVLSHGRRDDVAGELQWLDVAAGGPIDGSASPRVVIPFPEGPRKVIFGSLTVDGRSADVYLGEENGNRVYRFTADKRLEPVAVGLQHLVGGSGIAIDHQGRLVILDFASPETNLRSETRVPSGLDAFAAEGYQGPLVFRLDLRDMTALPRRLDFLSPVFPRYTTRPALEPSRRFISVAILAEDDMVLLDSLGHLSRLSRGEVTPFVRLPAGHYHRTNIAVGSDGVVWVSSGFHVRDLFRVSAGGAVSVVATLLADPAGIVVDREGRVYVVETALHRIVRIQTSR